MSCCPLHVAERFRDVDVPPICLPLQEWPSIRVSVSHDTIQQCDFPLKSPSSPPSTPRTFTINASFSSFAHHGRSFSSAIITKLPPWWNSLMTLLSCSAHTRMECSNLELHVRHCVHDNRCEIRRRVSCSVHALEQQTTPHPDLVRSGDNSAKHSSSG